MFKMLLFQKELGGRPGGVMAGNAGLRPACFSIAIAIPVVPSIRWPSLSVSLSGSAFFEFYRHWPKEEYLLQRCASFCFFDSEIPKQLWIFKQISKEIGIFFTYD